MFKTIASGALKAIALSVGVNTLLYFVFHATGTISDEIIIPNAGGPLTVFPVIMASSLPLVVGTLVYLALVKFTRNPMRLFRLIGLTLLLLSFGSPFSIPQVTTGMAVVLNIMHVVTAGSLLFMLPDIKKNN